MVSGTHTKDNLMTADKKNLFRQIADYTTEKWFGEESFCRVASLVMVFFIAIAGRYIYEKDQADREERREERVMRQAERSEERKLRREELKLSGEIAAETKMTRFLLEQLVKMNSPVQFGDVEIEKGRVVR